MKQVLTCCVWHYDQTKAHIFDCLFIVCPKCGNKRCPKATWCGYKCTGSNEPGQIEKLLQEFGDSLPKLSDMPSDVWNPLNHGSFPEST